MISNYILYNKIGEGGYSSVYRCKDKVGISYACKKILKNKVQKDRIINEIEVMKSLAYCPTTIKIIEAGEDNDNYYIIQELCRKGSLKDYITMNKIQEEKELISIVRGILRALYHIHNNGIIHCDVKLGNVFIFDDCNEVQIKLGDFGNSTRIGNESKDTTYISGTPHFMAPETLNFVYDTKSDIWSLGCILYELCCG